MWANFFFLLNSAINPLIYFIGRSDIRLAAKEILLGKVTNVADNPNEANRPRARTVTFNVMMDGAVVLEGKPTGVANDVLTTND